jgi:hypothetical protein
MNLAFIRTKYFPGQSASGINEGNCFIWAYIVKALYPHAKLYSASGHAFIKIGNKFYDSERPLGVLTWKQLKATSYCDPLDEEVIEQSKDSFRNYWGFTENVVKKVMLGAEK